MSNPPYPHNLRPVSVSQGAMNNLGQTEYRGRLVCDSCDTTVYLAVAPVWAGDPMAEALAAMHEMKPEEKD
jgi:hypothetical protein